CRKDQFASEYKEVLQFSFDMFKVFGFTDLKGYIAIRDPKNVQNYMGDPEVWDLAEKTIKEVVSDFNMPYEIEEGGAKFYGPSLDIKAKDSIGREWQLTTIQLDFQNPKKFNMTYQGPEKEEQPIMIHRALLGSLERFFGVLIEHYGGSFPTWISPVQVKIVSVGEKHADYCEKLKKEFLELDLRSEVDIDNETVANKIRKAVGEKIPYIIVVGDKEIEGEDLAIRKRGEQKIDTVKKSEFIKNLLQEIEDKK
ncbi:MAG TPA: His/Gly/Thr/Pro-type tRNA ligase C-terminal domain-containing protein, partial [bacterium]|nr:His/Gly/Thr/Pro-type tRNA ligase C-terminal domain-containing protein [bacterium]